MSERANVSSIAALEDFRAAIAEFVEEAERALTGADADLARVQSALSRELPAYWKGELRRREENVVRARIALEQASASREMGKSTVEERKQLARAKREVEEARARQEATRRWRTRLDRAELVYRGRIEPLRTLLHAGAPRALAALRAMGERLDEYVSIQNLPPEDAPPSGTPHAGGAPSMARSGARRPRRDDPLATVAARLPTPDQVAGAPEAGADAIPSFTLTPEHRFRLGALADGRGVDPRAFLLVGDGAMTAHRLALHRVAGVLAEDCGWRIVPLDADAEPLAWVRVSLTEILRNRPSLYDLLRLGEGWTGVVEPGAAAPLHAVYDPSGTEHWSSMRGDDAGDEPTRSRQA